MRKRLPMKSILIIRITAIGDIVMASPVPTALKQQNPNYRITWIVHPEFAPLLEGHPAIDEIITFDLNNWLRLWRRKSIIALWIEARRLRKLLHAHNFDRAIDLQGSFLTGFIAWLSGAAHRIALGSENTNSWFMTKTISRTIGDQTQIGSQYRYLINQLGCSDTHWEMHVPTSKVADASAKQLLQEKLGGDAYAVIVPFAQYAQKNWFDDYWQQIILRIRGRYKLKTVVVGGDNGLQLGENLARTTGAINFAGKTSLLETAAIIKGASLLIGVDTGLTHMGHALKIPTIALFGATSPYTFVDSDTSKVIYLDRFCSPCRRRPTCGGKFQCMREITPDRVLTTIKPLMKKINLVEKEHSVP